MKKCYSIKLRLLSAMHINGGTSVDSKRLIVKCDGKPYVPATLLKGMIRANFEMLINTYAPENISVSDKFFGSEGYNRSHVILDNLVTEQKIQIESRSNIAISRYTRKVNDQALVFSEVASCYDTNGNASEFSGDMTVYFSDETNRYEKYLLEAVRMINFIGSGKSRGMGFTEVTIDEKTC